MAVQQGNLPGLNAMKMNAGMDFGVCGMTLVDFPPECWQIFVPKERAVMMSMVSKGAKEKMERACVAVDVCLSAQFWFRERTTDADAKRAGVLERVEEIAGTYRIQSLGLAQFGMTYADFPKLGKALEKCKELKCLDLEQNDLGVGLRGLVGIAGLKSLTTLNLKRVNKKSYCSLSLAEIVGFFPFLGHLDLEGNNLGLTRGAWEKGEVCRSPALKFLGLKENYLKGDGLQRVKEVVLQCPGLTHLDLSFNTFGSAEMDALVGMFSQCTLLMTLNFDGNDMDHVTDGDLTLAQALSPLASLTNLDLQFNRLGGLEHMGVVLGRCVGLRYLNLSEAMIHDSGATTLARVLGTCAEMRVLHLSTNWIGLAGAEALAGALGRCENLVGLNMSNNVIRERGAEALGAVVGRIKHLSLSNCGIGARGVGALSTTFLEELEENGVDEDLAGAMGGTGRNWRALASLSISSNALGARGMHGVVRVLETYTALTNLYLARNNVQDTGVGILANGLTKCGALRELSLTNNGIGDAGATCLARALPQCTALTELFIAYNEGIGSEGVRVLNEAAEAKEMRIDVRQRSFQRP